ncbi:lipoprotein N-acyltransferase Lnb domain-containing protein [Ancylomarina sp. YFZ004]
MRHLFFLLLLSLFLASPIRQVQAQDSKAQIKISILTCSPGLELYSLFGHSAIRVQDPSRKLDIVFNYGIFDFNTPNFYPKFVRGKLKYSLGIGSFERFKRDYKYKKQSVVEQELNLSPESKHKLLRALEKNYRPENRYYMYDFLFKNCSTMIRDIIQKEIVGQFEYKDSNIRSEDSYRELLSLYMTETPWIYTGIHLALGFSCDAEASNYQRMFLPDMLKNGFDQAVITQGTQTTKLVIKENIILSKRANQTPTPWYKHPLFVFGMIALIGLLLTLSSIKNKKRFVLLDVIVFGSTALFGLVIIFLWGFTDHLAMRPNYNILWALPIHLPLLHILFKKNRPAWVKSYFKYHSIFILLLIAAWPIFPQALPYTILPFVILILIRSIFNATRS